MATDEQLIQQIQKGQSEAYGQLFSKYYQPIYSVCFAILRNPQDAEEVTSETFVHAYLKLDQLRKPSQFFFWLRKIAQNRSNNFLRDKPKETTPLDLASVQTKAQIAPDALLLRQELIDAICEKPLFSDKHRIGPKSTERIFICENSITRRNRRSCQ